VPGLGIPLDGGRAAREAGHVARLGPGQCRLLQLHAPQRRASQGDRQEPGLGSRQGPARRPGRPQATRGRDGVGPRRPVQGHSGEPRGPQGPRPARRHVLQRGLPLCRPGHDRLPRGAADLPGRGPLRAGVCPDGRDEAARRRTAARHDGPLRPGRESRPHQGAQPPRGLQDHRPRSGRPGAGQAGRDAQHAPHVPAPALRPVQAGQGGQRRVPHPHAHRRDDPLGRHPAR